MKVCKECGTISYDKERFCFICGTQFPPDQEPEVIEQAKDLPLSKTLEKSSEEFIPGILSFTGVYTYINFERGYRNDIAFFPDGKVAGAAVGLTSKPTSRGEYQSYQSTGTYVLSNGYADFRLTSESGTVIYHTRILQNALLVDSESLINGYKASGVVFQLVEV